jgi:tRNA A58 N-methylase Trm61
MSEIGGSPLRMTAFIYTPDASYIMQSANLYSYALNNRVPIKALETCW